MRKNQKPQKFKNVYIDYASNFEKYKIDEFHGLETFIYPIDKNRIEYYIKQEGSYYNSLVTGIAPFIRNAPNTLKLIKEKYFELYCTLSEIGFKLSPCMYKKIKLPNELTIYEELIYGTEFKKRQITPEIAYIMDIVSSSANIISYMRKNIAKEILFNTVDQIEKLNVKSMDEDGEIVYQKPMEILEPIDPHYRNTLQITKDNLKITYDKKNNCSIIRSAYFTKPVVVINTDLVECKNWNILVIKFTYGQGNNKIWTISTKKVSSDYLIRVSSVKKAR